MKEYLKKVINELMPETCDYKYSEERIRQHETDVHIAALRVEREINKVKESTLLTYSRSGSIGTQNSLRICDSKDFVVDFKVSKEPCIGTRCHICVRAINDSTSRCTFDC